KMKAICWDDSTQGVLFTFEHIPAELRDLAATWHRSMVEEAAEANETLMDNYLEHGTLPEEDMVRGLRIRTLAGEIQPMLCGSAFKNKGVQRILDAVIEFLPSPDDIPPVAGVDDDGNPVTRRPADDERFSALAFKLM